VLEPRTLAKMLEVLDVQPSHVVLDLGCGLGYTTAVLAMLADLADFVVGVEDDADLARDAQTNLSEQGVHNAAVMENPLADGSAKSGPYEFVTSCAKGAGLLVFLPKTVSALCVLGIN